MVLYPAHALFYAHQLAIYFLQHDIIVARLQADAVGVAAPKPLSFIIALDKLSMRGILDLSTVCFGFGITLAQPLPTCPVFLYLAK